MKIFQFRLQPVLTHRLRLRDEASIALAQTREELLRLDSAIKDLIVRYQNLMHDQQQVRTGRVQIASLQTADQQVTFLLNEQSQLRKLQARLRDQSERQQAALLDAATEVKKLEKLCTSQRSAFVADRKRLEQQSNDDQAVRARFMQQRNPAPRG